VPVPVPAPVPQIYKDSIEKVLARPQFVTGGLQAPVFFGFAPGAGRDIIPGVVAVLEQLRGVVASLAETRCAAGLRPVLPEPFHQM
jgi:hypothetical protein